MSETTRCRRFSPLSVVKGAARQVGFAVGSAVPLWAYRRLVKRRSLSFLYHAVSDFTLPHLRHLYSYKSSAMFESDIAFLKEKYRLPSIADLLSDSRAGNEADPARPQAFLSFDDGLAECHSVVRPILQKNRVPCAFFVITDCIDNKRLMYRHKASLCIDRLLSLNRTEQADKLDLVSRILEVDESSIESNKTAMKSLGISGEPTIDRICELLDVRVSEYLRIRRPYMTEFEIRQLARDGFVIGAHTRRHPFLGDLSPDEIEREIVESCEIVRSITGEKSVPFAFPFSGDRVDRSFLGRLRSKHSVIGPMFDTHGFASDQPFIMNRLTADERPGRYCGRSNLGQLMRREYCSWILARWR